MAASLAYASPKLNKPTHTGVVNEMIICEDITFMQIIDEGDEYWIGVGKSDANIGDRVSFKERRWIENFNSEVLDRTFEIVLLVSNFKILSSEVAVTATKPSKT